ncbi:MAG: efflux RND transporter periplasmic adaptor subunit [Spirochaetes bacterium]|nr:efflux RND transporter periplasmic adaptor subunit [Spirochaetota bacterium]
MTNRNIRYFILFSVLLIIIIIWFLSRAKQIPNNEEIVIPVETIKPMYGNIEKTLVVSGFVKSESVVTILPKISGSLISLLVSVGDKVKEGQIIGEIDQGPYLLQYEQIKAAFESAKSTFERVETLYKNGATSKQNYEQAKAQYEAYRSQYELSKLQLGYTKIVSPVNGVVLMTHSVPGSLVAPQVPIVTIGDLSNLVVEVKVPEKYYFLFSKLQNQMEIYITFQDFIDKKIKGKIKYITPFISPETKTFTVICSIQDIKEILPGMSLNVNFVIDKREKVYYLPIEVLLLNNFAFYVDEKSSKAYKIKLDVTFSNDQYFQIPKEYKDYKFIIDGQHFLKEGQKVNIIEEHTVY